MVCKQKSQIHSIRVPSLNETQNINMKHIKLPKIMLAIILLNVVICENKIHEIWDRPGSKQELMKHTCLSTDHIFFLRRKYIYLLVVTQIIQENNRFIILFIQKLGEFISWLLMSAHEALTHLCTMASRYIQGRAAFLFVV